MARRTEKKKRAHSTTIDRRDTFRFTPDVEVVRQPTPSGTSVIDPSVSRARSFTESLNALTSGLSTFTRTRQVKAQNDLTEGAESFELGESLEDQKSAKAREGWMRRKGAVQATRLKTEASLIRDKVNNLRGTDDELSSEDVSALWAQAIRKHSGNLDEFGLRSFMPQATDIEGQLLDLLTKDSLEFSKSIVKDDTRDIVRDRLYEILGVNEDTLEGLLEDSGSYERIQEYLDDNEDTIGSLMRSLLDEAQETNKGFISRDETSEIFYSVIGEVASLYGLPQLNKVTDIQDSHSISLKDTSLSSVIAGVQEKAMSKQRSIRNLHKDIIDRQEDQLVTDNVGSVLTFLDNTEQGSKPNVKDIESLKSGLNDAYSTGRLNYTTWIGLNRSLNSIASGVAHFTDPNVYTDLVYKAGMGELTIDDVTDNKDRLAPQEFKQLLGSAVKIGSSVGDLGNFFEPDSMLQSVRSKLNRIAETEEELNIREVRRARIAGKPIPLLVTFPEVQAAEQVLRSEYVRYLQENANRKPPLKWYSDIQNDLEKIISQPSHLESFESVQNELDARREKTKEGTDDTEE